MMHSYLCGVSLIPTVHAANTVYFSLFNNGPGEVGVHQLSIETMSATGSGNTRCTYVLARASGTHPTGGSNIVVAKLNTDSPYPPIDLKGSNSGLTRTDLVVDPYFFQLAIRTGSDGHYMAHKCNCQKGIMLYPGQGIVLFNDNEGIEGASIHGCMEISYTED